MPAQQDYVDRLQVNMVYYQANYIGIVLLNLLLVCFWRPVFLLGLTTIVGSAIYLFSVRKAPIRVGDGKVLTKREVFIGASTAPDRLRTALQIGSGTGAREDRGAVLMVCAYVCACVRMSSPRVVMSVA